MLSHNSNPNSTSQKNYGVQHIDLDVSGILRRDLNLDSAGDQLIDITLRTANGRLTAAEVLGHREFVLTKLYRSA